MMGGIIFKFLTSFCGRICAFVLLPLLLLWLFIGALVVKGGKLMGWSKRFRAHAKVHVRKNRSFEPIAGPGIHIFLKLL